MYLSLDQYFFECLKFNSRRQKIKAPGSFGLKINEQIKKKSAMHLICGNRFDILGGYT